MSGLMTTAQAAEFLKISQYTTREKMLRGEIKAVRLGREWRTRPEWLEDFIAKQVA